jgi:hypothetical protein
MLQGESEVKAVVRGWESEGADSEEVKVSGAHHHHHHLRRHGCCSSRRRRHTNSISGPSDCRSRSVQVAWRVEGRRVDSGEWEGSGAAYVWRVPRWRAVQHTSHLLPATSLPRSLASSLPRSLGVLLERATSRFSFEKPPRENCSER